MKRAFRFPLLLLILGLLCGLPASSLAAENNTDWLNDGTAPHAKAQPNTIDPQTVPLESAPNSLLDNDVYLFTPELWRLLERYTAGEIFDLDQAFDRLIAQHPGLFPLYFYNGLIKVRRLLLTPEIHKDDERIVELFNTCTELARRAQKVPEFRLAGLFYETTCEGGHGLFSGVRGRYLDSKQRGQLVLENIERLAKERPTLHAVVLIKGMYNFYTGRFGALTAFLLRLAGMPVGDEALGLKLIEQAVSTPSPVRYLALIYAIYAFSPRWELRERSFELAGQMVAAYPKNYYSYMMRAYVYDKKNQFKEALADALKGRSLVPGPMESYQDPTVRGDLFILDVRAAYLDALLNHSKRSLAFLLDWARKKPGTYEYYDAPLMACMHLGHLFSIAGYEPLALVWYRNMQNFPEAQWMKDVGKSYESRPIGRSPRVSPPEVQSLRAWLDKHPEAKP